MSQTDTAEFWTSRGSTTNRIVHSDRDCYHLEQSGDVRTVSEGEAEAARLCERCAGVAENAEATGCTDGGCPMCDTAAEEIDKLAYHLLECPGAGDSDE